MASRRLFLRINYSCSALSQCCGIVGNYIMTHICVLWLTSIQDSKVTEDSVTGAWSVVSCHELIECRWDVSRHHQLTRKRHGAAKTIISSVENSPCVSRGLQRRFNGKWVNCGGWICFIKDIDALTPWPYIDRFLLICYNMLDASFAKWHRSRSRNLRSPLFRLRRFTF